jgi:hypothetical protein
MKLHWHWPKILQNLRYGNLLTCKAVTSVCTKRKKKFALHRKHNESPYQRHFWSTSGHHRVHMNHPLVLILSKMQSKTILILSSHLRIGLRSGLFSPGFQSPTCIHFLPKRAMWSAQHIRIHFIILIKLGEEYKLRSSCLSTFHLISLRPKYSSQHPVLTHFQSVFFP